MESSLDPELQLRLASGAYSSSADSSSSTSIRVSDWFANATKTKQQHQQQQQQQITMFYDGKVCVCDVTEIQAKAIISMAMREMGERRRRSTPTDGPQPALSMKRSLQRFLQKRKMRMDAASPYNVSSPAD